MEPQVPQPPAGNVGIRVSIYSEVDGRTTDLLFNQFPVRVGRNPMNDLVLNHQYVSQWHAVIGLSGSTLSITQVGSSNSVMIGEVKLRPNEELVLTGQEEIRIVPFSLRIQPVMLPSSQQASGGRQGSGYFESVIAQVADSAPATEQQELERIALKAFDRLSSRFLGRTIQTPRELAYLAWAVEATLSVFFRFFVALQKGQEQFRQALDIPALQRSRQNPVEQAGEANELGALLLGGDRESIAALESAFKNTLLHQVALVNGLMAGVRSLLEQLSPATVEAAAQQEHRSPSWRQLWETYQQLHRDLAEEDTQTFETIFGPQFGKAYANLFGKKAKKK